MTKKVTKKVTIEDILKKKNLIDNAKPEPFYSDFFGGEIEVEDVPVDRVIEIMSNANASEPLRADYELIYTCCPIFRAKELQEQYNIQDPIDVVKAVYGKNLNEPNQLAKHLMRRYGFYLGEGKAKIKKQ